jgi:putative endonuclease
MTRTRVIVNAPPVTPAATSSTTFTSEERSSLARTVSATALYTIDRPLQPALRRATPRSRARPRAAIPITVERRSVGTAAEKVVSDWLESRGLRILASNLRVGYLEVDLLVQDGRSLVLVEVRTRSPGSWTSAFGSIDGWKRTRLRRAGERLWRREYRFRSEFDHVRFDVASVSWHDGVAEVEYIRAAF